MKKLKDLNALMEEQLRDMFDGEIQLSKALNFLHEHANGSQLCEILEEFIEQNNDQVLHLKQAFNLLYKQKRGERCDAMRALCSEAEEQVERGEHWEVIDAAIVTALQHILHYQMTNYGAIYNYALALGFDDVARLMYMDLEKERALDKKLGQLAEEVVNQSTAVLS